MHSSLFLAFTFFASLDAHAATPAQKEVSTLLTRCEVARPDCATVALHDGKRIVVLQSPGMAVEVRASRLTKGWTAANLVAGLASRVAARKIAEKAA